MAVIKCFFLFFIFKNICCKNSCANVLFCYDVYNLLRNIDFFDNVSGKFVTKCFFCFCNRIFFADVNRNGNDCFCLSSWAGHSWWNTESVWPSASQSSSPICGANGARSRTTDSRVSLSMPPSFLAIAIRLLLHSMKPEITVFRLKPSRRVVIMWIIL